jgi:hypothetical protein
MLTESTKYKLEIDSASVYSLTGIPNNELKTTFKTQKSDFYGTIILEIQGYEGNGIVYLLKNSDKEEVLDTVHFTGKEKTLTFHFLKPEKYRVKLLDDRDGNGEWTTGSLLDRRQPERVYYFPKIVKVRSNWESKDSWTIDRGTVIPKKLVDDDLEKK